MQGCIYDFKKPIFKKLLKTSDWLSKLGKKLAFKTGHFFLDMEISKMAPLKSVRGLFPKKVVFRMRNGSGKTIFFATGFTLSALAINRKGLIEFSCIIAYFESRMHHFV